MRHDIGLMIITIFVLYIVVGIVFFVVMAKYDPDYENEHLTQINKERDYNCKYNPEYYPECQNVTGEDTLPISPSVSSLS